MKIILLATLFLSLFAFACSQQTISDQEVLQLLINYGFDETTNTERFLTTKQNINDIIKHNSNPDSTYQLTVNKFTFYTQEEKDQMMNWQAEQDCSATAQWTSQHQQKKKVNLKDLPKSVDWRNTGKVTDVKNQGSCGSCWTFSTTGALESHWAIAKGTGATTLLSEQQLVDCAGDFKNMGCNGGLPSQAFEYIYYNKGIDTEASYPYKGYDGKCKFNPKTIGAVIDGVYNVTFQDENDIQQILANTGPVSIAFQVLNDFFSYNDGVYSNPDCSTEPTDVNHAVLVVGYDETSEGQKYWIVKNSWGSNWGLDGYFWLERGTNMCGISDCASYPIVNKSKIITQ